MSTLAMLIGFVDACADTPPGVPAHRRVPCGGRLDAVLVDRAPGAQDGPGVEATELALAQVAILSAYVAETDVLPVALGAAFSSEDALRAHLAPLMERLHARRRALAGQCEWLVAIDGNGSGAAPPPAAGAGYLRRRQAERQARHDLSAARRAFVGGVIGAFDGGEVRLRAQDGGPRGSLAVVAGLVHRAALGPLRARLEDLAAEGERLGLALRLIGPCAPFSFVATEGPDG
jgi:hypothetical protein